MEDELFDKDGGDRQHKARELELYTIRQLMKTENGRNFMWRCLENCSVFESVFNADPTLHTYKAGARDHGLWLERELKEAAPDEYIKMLTEHM